MDAVASAATAMVWTPRRDGRGGGRVAVTSAVLRRGWGGNELLSLEVGQHAAELTSSTSSKVVRAALDGPPGVGVSGAWLLYAAGQFWPQQASSKRPTTVLVAGTDVLRDGQTTTETTLYVVENESPPPPRGCLDAPRKAKWGGGQVMIDAHATVRRGLGDNEEELHVVVRDSEVEASSPSSEQVLRTRIADDDVGVRGHWLLYAAAAFWYGGDIRGLELVAGFEKLAEDAIVCEDFLYVASRMPQIPQPWALFPAS